MIAGKLYYIIDSTANHCNNTTAVYSRYHFLKILSRYGGGYGTGSNELGGVMAGGGGVRAGG